MRAFKFFGGITSEGEGRLKISVPCLGWSAPIKYTTDVSDAQDKLKEHLTSLLKEGRAVPMGDGYFPTVVKIKKQLRMEAKSYDDFVSVVELQVFIDL